MQYSILHTPAHTAHFLVGGVQFPPSSPNTLGLVLFFLPITVSHLCEIERERERVKQLTVRTVQFYSATANVSSSSYKSK